MKDLTKMEKGGRSPEAAVPQLARKPYRKPEIVEFGATVELTRSYLNGGGDLYYGSPTGSEPGFHRPRRH